MAQKKIKGKKEISCCLYCGRDTTAAYRICARCLRGPRAQFCAQINDTKDRPRLTGNELPLNEDDLEYDNYYKSDSVVEWYDRSHEYEDDINL